MAEPQGDRRPPCPGRSARYGTFRRMMLCAALVTICVSAMAQGQAGLVEDLPSDPVRTHLIDETAETPEDRVNPCARWIDRRLEKALADELQEVWPRDTWQEAPQFLNWAVWGYLSADSRFHGDERLVSMMGEWIDAQIEALETPPEEPEKRADWNPRRLPFWTFHNASLPLLELLDRPDLAAEVGEARVEAWRDLCVENVERWGEPDAWNDLIERADDYVNIATHPMAAFVHGWILTGEQRYLEMAARIIGILARGQAPSGSFPYRHFGGDHLESEAMYYHSMNVRALYLYWWHTGSELAAETLRRSAPYYPLRMAPKYHCEYHTVIWWKNQWRTFWPNHIAMVAAVTGDGENAAIANAMARDNVSADRTDLVLGSHAYQQMALREAEESERRGDYIIEDPDIGGLRGRYGRLDFNFSTNSYSHTLAGAMATSEDGKRYAALHRACPLIRTAPLSESHRTSPNYWALGRHSPGRELVIADDFAAAASTYAPFQPSTTWRPLHRSAPWKIAQAWLYTPTTVIGLMIDVPTLPTQAREVCHQLRFILAGDSELVHEGDGHYDAGLLSVDVHATNLEHAIIERTRRYELNTGGRKDWQLALSDRDRSPVHIAQAEEPPEELKLPEPELYEPGDRRYSLVEISPADESGAEAVGLQSEDQVWSFLAEIGDMRYLLGVNLHDFGSTFDWTPPDGVEKVELFRSWADGDEARETVEVGDGITLSVKGAGLFVITY